MNTTTRVGKIARLSKHVRDELGRRIENGVQGKELVKWLNGLPKVKAVLKAQFNGHSITEQNVSHWKQGGHQDWLRQQETCHLAQHLQEKAGDLKAFYQDDEYFTELDIAEDLAVLLTAELARLADVLLKEKADPQEQMRRLLVLLHPLGQLRRHNHRAARLQRDKLLWQREEEQPDKDAEYLEYQKQKSKILKPLFAQMAANELTEVFGGGEADRKLATFIAEVQSDLPLGTLTGVQEPGSAKLNSAQSDQIQPNPIQSNQNFPNLPNHA